MTKHEFCKIMEAGHQQASDNLVYAARSTRSRTQANDLYASAAEQGALATAFRDLAKEHEDD